jgi:DNA-binding PucR family transcriptional regulator
VSSAAPWPLPSPEVAELIRAATGKLLLHPEELFSAVDAAVLASQPDTTAADPEVAASIRASNRANLAHWAAANLSEPGAHVPPYRGPETLEIAREVVRRGLDDNSLEAYRVGQNIVWRHWMRTAFELSGDPDQIRQMLDLSARSIFTFVDETLATIHEAMEHERSQVTSRTHTERMEIVNLILEHAPITVERASRRLRYELGRGHTAAIVWSDVVGPRDPGELEAAAEVIARQAGADRPLIVVPSASTLWIWFAAAPAANLEALQEAELPAGAVRVAVGTTHPGIDGFRRSHLHALATQRLMRRAPGELRIAAYADVRVVALAAADEEATTEFVAATLGDLAGADIVLRETLRTYIREQFSASRTARALFTHRNTVLGRIGRARSLLPAPLEGNGLEVGLALEIIHWLRP